MKLSELANDYLSWMVKSYSKDHNRLFHWEQIRNQFPDEVEEFICDAFRLLHHDGFVTSQWADNHVYLSQLEVNAIRDAEANTRLVKAYQFLKEIRSWI